MLTPKQQQLVTDNHALVFKFLQHHHLVCDDWLDVAEIGLCKAAQDYDPTRGTTFSTCAFLYMWREFLHYQSAERKEYRNQQLISVHLEDIIQGVENKTFGDSLHINQDLTAVEAAEIIETLTPREKAILYLRMIGAEPKTMQKAVGHGRATVCNIRKGIKQKALVYMEG